MPPINNNYPDDKSVCLSTTHNLLICLIDMFEIVTKSIVPLEILLTGTEMPWFDTVQFLMEHFREKSFLVFDEL